MAVKNVSGAYIDVDEMVGDGYVMLAVHLTVGEVDVRQPYLGDVIVDQSGHAFHVAGIQHQAMVRPLLTEVERCCPRLCPDPNQIKKIKKN